MKHVVGKCPQCGGQVVEFSKFYGCADWRPIDGACPFTIPKRFTGKDIEPHIAAELIKKRCSRRLDGFVSPKTGTSFPATLELHFNGQVWRLKMRFTD